MDVLACGRCVPRFRGQAKVKAPSAGNDDDEWEDTAEVDADAEEEEVAHDEM